MRPLTSEKKKLTAINNNNSSSSSASSGTNNKKKDSLTNNNKEKVLLTKSRAEKSNKTATTSSGKMQQQQQQKPALVNKSGALKKHQNNNSSSPSSATTLATTTAAVANTTKSSTTAVTNAGEEIAGGVQDTIYLCNFRVSVDGEWLCLKELNDVDVQQNGDANTGIVGRHSQYGCKNKRYSGNFAANGFDDNARDSAEIERSNLVNICKLVVKELLEQSLRYGRMLDSDHLPLQHFFIVLEHVLGHGLRQKKGLLGPRKELWDLLQSVENYCPEAQDITASVRDLPTVRTHIGRARAWLRIALMQKKLADYLQALIEHREEALYEYYEPHALMMSDEVVIIMGMLVGLNVIDCNLCVKEEDLDSQQGVIDFSLYLRSSSRSAENDYEQTDANNTNVPFDGNGQENMIAVLDQKNYIEELNRHLNATVGNLQAKVESLTTTNALMKEDLAIARNSLLALQAENQAMRQNTNATGNSSGSVTATNGADNDNSSQKSTSTEKSNMEALTAELAEEKKKYAELDKELKLQISLKAESDMAMKLLEKDIHEKQDTIISLRRQLDDIKQINLEMYRKLQECESSLKHKSDLLTKLETQKEDMANSIVHLEKKLNSDKSNLGEILKNTSQTLTTIEERAARAEADTRIEREWRISLQEKETKLKEQITSLQNYVKELTEEVQKNEKLKMELEKLRTQWSEAQTTLEELGIQLSVSKLKVSELEDREKRVQKQQLRGSNSSLQSPVSGLETPVLAAPVSVGIWAPDSIATHCTGCAMEFNLTRRKHHCRSCGDIFCNACSEHRATLLVSEQGKTGKPVRVCDICYATANQQK